MEIVKITKTNYKKYLKIMQQIEDVAYNNEDYKYIIDIDTYNDLINYTETSKIEVLCDETLSWYMLIGYSGKELTIIDLASKKGISKDIVSSIISYFENHSLKIIRCDSRESTSYQIIKKLDKKTWIIESDIPYDWSGEIFHEIIISKKHI